MRALRWHGKHDIRCDNHVPDPSIEDPRDAIIKVSSCAICGSDLHLYDGFMPGMQHGDIMGHEFMGEVMEVGSANKKLKVGDRVVVPFTIVCGECDQCRRGNFSVCERTNRNKDIADKGFGHTTAGLYGYTHLTGGYAGGQAEYVRVPYADVGPVVIPEGLADDDVLFLSDILPTGWQAAVNADIEPGGTVAVWGCGPGGLFTIQSALLLGAGRVIAIDHFPTRLALAKKYGAEILDYTKVDVREALAEMTGGIGPDACIDCVGMESHGFTVDNILDQVKVKLLSSTERIHALRQAILACRKGGRLSIPGVYGGFADKFPLGQLMEKGLTVKSGQTHVQRYSGELLDMIQAGKFDTVSLISHHASLEDAAEMYRHWHDEQDLYTKIVLKPGLAKGAVSARQEMEHA